MKRNILFTGISGMIGSVLSRDLIKKGYKVCGVDDFSSGYPENIDDSIKDHVFPVDIRNADALDRIFAVYKPNYVIHLGARAEEILSPFIRSLTYSVNVVGSANVINCCVNHKVEKILFFSSVARYGDGSEPPFYEDAPVCEKEPYALSKVLIEKDLQEAYEHFGLNYSVVVPFNVFSPFQNFYSLYRNVLAIFVRKAINNQDLTVYGDGKAIRSYSDCKFLCDPVEKLLTNYNSEIFNMGSSKPITVLEAAQIVQKIAKVRGFNPGIVHLEPRKEVEVAYCDTTKSQKLLGLNDQTNLEETLNEMFDVALKQPKRELKKINYEITKNIYSYWK